MGGPGRSGASAGPSTAASFDLDALLEDVLGTELVDELVEEAPEGSRRGGGGGRRRSVSTAEGDGHAPVDARAEHRFGDEASPLPTAIMDELAVAVGPERGAAVGRRLAAAARAYERDRYQDAFRITRPMVDEVPESAAVRELHGLVCYRLGRWRDAIRHLTAAGGVAGDDPSQLPVRMDCHRALGHHHKVGQLWEELRAASPAAEVVVEGRLVLAADLADQGRLGDAIALLVAGGVGRDLRRPAARHLRQWYLLADLSERAGDLHRARELFERVVAADPDVADAAERLAALGGPAMGRALADRRSPTTLGDIARAGRAARRG